MSGDLELVTGVEAEIGREVMHDGLVEVRRVGIPGGNHPQPIEHACALVNEMVHTLLELLEVLAPADDSGSVVLPRMVMSLHVGREHPVVAEACEANTQP